MRAKKREENLRFVYGKQVFIPNVKGEVEHPFLVSVYTTARWKHSSKHGTIVGTVRVERGRVMVPLWNGIGSAVGRRSPHPLMVMGDGGRGGIPPFSFFPFSFVRGERETMILGDISRSLSFLPPPKHIIRHGKG